MAKYQVEAQSAGAQKQKALLQGPMSGTTPPGGIGGPQETEQPADMTDYLEGSQLQPSDTTIEATPEGPVMNNPRVGVIDLAKNVAKQLNGMEAGEQGAMLSRIQSTNPQLYGVVVGFLSGADSIKPQAEQRPPRSTSLTT